MTRILKQVILTMLFAIFATQASAIFIQPDWFDPTQPGVGTNRYAYSFNDPINLRDPNGNEVGPEDHDDPTDLARDLQEEDSELFDELSNNYDLSELPLDDPRVQALIESYRAYAAGCGGPCPGGVIDRFINGGPGAEIQRQIGAAAGFPGVEASEQAQIATVAGAMAVGVGRNAKTLPPSGTTRVGRWMSPTELANMKSTSRVIESSSGTTHVAVPASSATFGRQAATGSAYVEFNVSSETLLSTGTGTARIITPNSRAAQQYQRLGRPVPTQSPPVYNINVLGTK